MKKTKLFGTRIIENVPVPRTPDIVMLEDYEGLSKIKFKEGDLLDARSIRRVLQNSSGAGGSHNTDDLDARIKALEKEINVLPFDHVEQSINSAYIIDQKVSSFAGGIVYDQDTKQFYAVNGYNYYPQWDSYGRYPSSDVYNGDSTKVFQNISSGGIYRIYNGQLLTISGDSIYIGTEEPDDNTKLWVDCDDNENITDTDLNSIQGIRKAVVAMQDNMNVIRTLILNGVVAGTSENSARFDIVSDTTTLVTPPTSIEQTVGDKTGETVELVIPDNGYTTFSYSKPLDFSEFDFYALAGYYYSNSISYYRTFTLQDGKGVLIHGTPGTYQIPIVESVPADNNNQFLGTGEGTVVVDDYPVTYAFNKQDLSFQPVDNGITLPQFKAYIKVNPSPEALVEPTVNHISIKMDTAINFSRNRQNLIDGEILYYTDKSKLVVYYNGGFHTIGTTDTASSGVAGITEDDLYKIDLQYLKFTDGTNEYKVDVNTDGSLSIRRVSNEVTSIGSPDSKYKVYVSGLLAINEVYCGGEPSDTCMCSHNFVELANGSNKDINLNGLMLLYTDGSNYDETSTGFLWKVLPLSGVIKAGSTYLIRGAKCNNYASEFITVDGYDQEWYDNGELIKFSQTSSSFYLAVGSMVSNWVYDQNGELYAKNLLSNPWNKAYTNKGYIDSCGFGSNAKAENSSPVSINQSYNWDDLLFVRWFMLDPSQQANKEYSKRTTSDLWTYINLQKNTQNLSGITQYYYPDYIKATYTPKASYQNKNFFNTRSQFNPMAPNVIRCTFGIQATYDDVNQIKASRCFNWVSVGYYDEYLEYRKVGSSTWNKVYSITENNYTNSASINKFIDHYKRLRWKTPSGTWVTTHKVILSNVLVDGTYEYRIGRDGNTQYSSEIKTFTVNKNSDVTTFSYIQVTDQQGFNWAEYQAWKKTAQTINKGEDNYQFLINTGDITQSGNRESEWLDYYDGLETWLGDKEEMFTIGNNDLCGHNSAQLTDGADATSKYNHVNVLRYFTFELDKDFDYKFTYNGAEYPIYSLYSFNYGKFHFICLNSETGDYTGNTYFDSWQDGTSVQGFAKALNKYQEAWLLQDLQKSTGNTTPTNCNNVIVYMHEMPFTIVTYDFMNGSIERAGSRLNLLDDDGKYRYSRLFKKYGIRLVMGGHKHTYCITKPIYDAPDGYITTSNTVDSNIDLFGDMAKDGIKDAMSRMPVIQVLSTNDVDSTMSSFARYEVVSKLNAPTYVMSQSSGYKLISNKEQPSDGAYQIPWLLAYFKSNRTGTKISENYGQHYPMYIRYDVSDTEIQVTAKQVYGIWEHAVDGSGVEYDMNAQMTNLSAVSMTLSQTIDADKIAYGITDLDKYTITL